MIRTTILFLAIFFLCATPIFAQFNTYGSAFSTSTTCYTLTPNIANQTGAVYSSGTVDLTNPFHIKFSVNLGANDGGADGITFLMRSNLTPPIGNGGGGVGYSGLTSSIGVEFDTYVNGANGDPNFDHLAIISNGNNNHNSANNLAGPIIPVPGLTNIENNTFYTFEVDWNPTTQKLTVIFDCQERLSYTGNIVNQFFSGNPNVYYGFVGSTGGASNLQQICLVNTVINHTPLSDALVCAGTPVPLNGGSNTYDYLWSPSTYLNNTTSNNVTSTPFDTVTYNLQITYNCDTVFDTVTVYTYENNTVDLGPNITFCQGDTAFIDAYNPNLTSYLWNNGSTAPQITTLFQGVFSVTATDTNGCVYSDNVSVSRQNAPIFNFSNDTSFCEGDSVEVIVSPGFFQYAWSTGASGTSDFLDSTGVYSVTATLNGCSYTDSIQIAELPPPQFSLGNDTALCAGFNKILSTGISGTYLWSNSATTPTITVSSTGNYWCEVTDATGCTNTDTITVTFTPAPIVNLGSDTTICWGDSIPLNATVANANYNWNTGDTLPVIFAATGGNYAVTVTTPTCQVNDTINIATLQAPSMQFPNDTAICIGDTVSISIPTQPATLLWFDGTSTLTKKFHTAGIYYAALNNKCGTVLDTFRLATLVGPKAELDPNVTLCLNESIRFEFNNDSSVSYYWNTGDTTSYLEVSQSGTYSVEAENICGTAFTFSNVELVQCECNLYFANAFSPGNDLINETFGPITECDFDFYHFQIFNRWGEIVFDSYVPGEFWDGRGLSGLIQKGIYAWSIDYTIFTGQQKEFFHKDGSILILD